MSNIVSVNQMISTLRDFSDEANRASPNVPDEILASIRRWIIITGTIDTGDLYVGFSVNEVASNVGHNFLIETNVGYEGFTEFDRPAYFSEEKPNQGRGRKYFQQGIEHAQLQPIFDEMVLASFR